MTNHYYCSKRKSYYLPRDTLWLWSNEYDTISIPNPRRLHKETLVLENVYKELVFFKGNENDGYKVL